MAYNSAKFSPITGNTYVPNVRGIPSPKQVVQSACGGIFNRLSCNAVKPAHNAVLTASQLLLAKYPQYDSILWAAVQLPNGRCIACTNVPLPGSTPVKGIIVWGKVVGWRTRGRVTLSRSTFLASRSIGPENRATAYNCRKVGLPIP